MITTSQTFIVAYLLTFFIPFLRQSNAQQCSLPPKTTPTRASNDQSQTVYKVGVFGIQGAEQAFNDYNITFNEYLTERVGSQFDPPIQFELVPIFNSKEGFLDFLAEGNVDFMFMHTGAYSCIESEVGARSLATVVSRRVVGGQVYELNGYGGVIFTRADNDEINSLEDIRGKRTSCVAITAFGSGQVQFRDLIQAGIHHIQDVGQLVFMEKQPTVVNAVLRGDVDVGYVRTDQLERTIDESTGALVDLSLIKVIRPLEGLRDDGKPFPFPSTSRLYPEWSLSAFPHVGNAVARLVQAEILDMENHAAIAPALLDCYEQNDCGDRSINGTTSCHDECFSSLNSTIFRSCDTTAELALFAYEAMLKGRIAGWSPSASYMEVRNMQEDLGFLQFDSESGVRCIRTTELSDAVTCPPGHFKKSDEEIAAGCEEAGIDCFGFQCLCSPCVKAYDVDFFPVYDDNDSEGMNDQLTTGSGCAKFEACGAIDQGQSVTFRAIDNRKRENAEFTVTILEGLESTEYPMLPARNGKKFQYEFTFSAEEVRVGDHVVIVEVDDEQIPESPFRLHIDPKDCVAETGDPLTVVTELGECVCQSGSVGMFSRCVSLSVILPSVLIPTIAILAIAIYWYTEQKRKAADAIWKVNPDELIYSDPPQVLGRGTFGMVLLAEYRGTNVAVKRVLPPKPSGSKKASNNDQFDFNDDDDEDDIGKTKTTSGTSSISGSTSHLNSALVSRSSSNSGAHAVFALFGDSNEAMYRKLEKDFVREMRLLSRLRHPCITTTMGAVLSSKSEPMMVMEHMDFGSLYDLLHNDSMVLDGEILLPILRDIARGLRFLHAADPQIVHSDLKSANVLVDGRFHAKVADFGLSRKRLLHGESAAGTPFWMAPELLRCESGNTPASDVYAFGIVLYEVLSRKDPYEGEHTKDVLQLVINKKVQKRPPIPKEATQESAALMKACIRDDPASRPTAEDISVRLDLLEANQVLNDSEIKRGKKKDSTAEDLLGQLFPQHIANALRQGRKVEPESHSSVTVYFSDIVNYTSISSGLSPTKVSSLLDRLYTKFDALCDKHDIFKVETVGDAYMTVTNIAKSQPKNHCEIMARFALDAMVAASTTLIDEEDPSQGYVQIRSGFHSGPVVAHVVGNRNPRYSIIGDTVNTASRMESNSKPGRIQCSEASAKLLQDAAGSEDSVFSLKRRGEVHIKGKGDMTLFWVLDSKEKVDVEAERSMEQALHRDSNKSLDPIREDDVSTEIGKSIHSRSQIADVLKSPVTPGAGTKKKQKKKWLNAETLWAGTNP